MRCELWCVSMCVSIGHGHDHGHGTSSSWAHIIKFAQWSTHTHILFVSLKPNKKEERRKKTKIHKSVERISTGVLNEAWRLVQSIVACHFVKFFNRTLRLQRMSLWFWFFHTEFSLVFSLFSIWSERNTKPYALHWNLIEKIKHFVIRRLTISISSIEYLFRIILICF